MRGEEFSEIFGCNTMIEEEEEECVFDAEVNGEIMKCMKEASELLVFRHRERGRV